MSFLQVRADSPTKEDENTHVSREAQRGRHVIEADTFGRSLGPFESLKRHRQSISDAISNSFSVSNGLSVRRTDVSPDKEGYRVTGTPASVAAEGDSKNKDLLESLGTKTEDDGDGEDVPIQPSRLFKHGFRSSRRTKEADSIDNQATKRKDVFLGRSRTVVSDAVLRSSVRNAEATQGRSKHSQAHHQHQKSISGAEKLDTEFGGANTIEGSGSSSRHWYSLGNRGQPSTHATTPQSQANATNVGDDDLGHTSQSAFIDRHPRGEFS